MPRAQDTIRLFVGIYPPPEVAEAMWQSVEPLQLPDHRPTRVHQLHMTIQFVGDVDVRDQRSVLESVERSASGVRAFTLTPLRLIALPKGSRPRLIALETDLPGELMELHRRLVQRLARQLRPQDREKFLPHFTIARFKHPASTRIEPSPSNIPGFEIRDVRLMRSVLKPGGAEHFEIARYELVSRAGKK